MARTRPLEIFKTNIPHVVRMDIDDDGVTHECAVVKQDQHGNIIYIKISSLDMIDRERLGKVLRNRFAAQLPLWDLLSQTTLKNGVNALDYFHQVVAGINSDGNKFIPRVGTAGYTSVNHTLQGQAQTAATQAAHAEAKKAEASSE